MVRLQNRTILWILLRKVLRNKDLYVKSAGIRSYAPDFALIARSACVGGCTASAWRGCLFLESVSPFFKEPNWVSKNQIAFFKEPIGLGASFFKKPNRAGRFVRSVFMVGLFGRLSQGLLRGENVRAWRIIYEQNKIEFRAFVKVGELGIFGGMDVYCLVIAPL